MIEREEKIAYFFFDFMKLIYLIERFMIQHEFRCVILERLGNFLFDLVV